MYNPTMAYFEDEEILARVQFLDELASDYFEAGYSEEEAEDLAMFDFTAIFTISKKNGGGDVVLVLNDRMH